MTTALLLTSAWIDFKTRTIPDIIPIFLLVWGLIKGMIFDAPIKLNTIAAITMFVMLLFSVLLMERLTKGFVLGGGDIKLISAFCFACGPFVCSSAMIIALSLQLLYAVYIKLSKKNITTVPFAPFLASGFILSKFIIGGTYV